MSTPFRLILPIAITAAVSLSAAVPSVWQASGTVDFLKGDLQNLSVDSHGRLFPAPSSTVLHDPSTPFVWSLVETANGMVYAGTGNDGRVIRIDPSGQTTVAFDSDELEAHALAAAPGGGVFVGTSPDGRVYKLDGLGGSAPFFDPPEAYIWSMAVDADDNLFVATGGEKSVVYKVTPSGTASTFYTAKATHAMALAFDGLGRLIVGTESPGRVIQLDAAGKPFILIDSPHTEIHSLRLAPDGALYAVASTAKPKSAAARLSAPTSTPTVSGYLTSAAALTESIGSETALGSTGASAGGTGAIYRIQQDGLWDLVWDVREDVPYDIAVDVDGGLLVATGGQGRIYRLHGNPAEASLVTRSTAQHVTAVIRSRAGHLLYASANPGRIVRMDAAPGSGGSYQSNIWDAGTVSTWGVIRWRATAPPGSSVVVTTRSGNTTVPDEAWSSWSAPYALQAGSPITSPKARYLQWRVDLDTQGDTPVLTSVAATYLQRNIRPNLTSVSVHPPGIVFQRNYPSSDPDIAGFELEPPDRKAISTGTAKRAEQLGKKVYEKGLMTFQWKAADVNGDELRYDVFYRREGDTTWKPLRQGLADPLLVWDTVSVPDGTYVIRVVASDAPSNPANAALTGHLDSAAFDIDNGPPIVTIMGVRWDGSRALVGIQVTDGASAIKSVEFTLDSRKWQVLYPRDGMTDSREEVFELALNGADVSRTVVIRATDVSNNAGSATLVTATPNSPAQH